MEALQTSRSKEEKGEMENEAFVFEKIHFKREMPLKQSIFNWEKVMCHFTKHQTLYSTLLLIFLVGVFVGQMKQVLKKSERKVIVTYTNIDSLEQFINHQPQKNIQGLVNQLTKQNQPQVQTQKPNTLQPSLQVIKNPIKLTNKMNPPDQNQIEENKFKVIQQHITRKQQNLKVQSDTSRNQEKIEENTKMKNQIKIVKDMVLESNSLHQEIKGEKNVIDVNKVKAIIEKTASPPKLKNQQKDVVKSTSGKTAGPQQSKNQQKDVKATSTKTAGLSQQNIKKTINKPTQKLVEKVKKQNIQMVLNKKTAALKPKTLGLLKNVNKGKINKYDFPIAGVTQQQHNLALHLLALKDQDPLKSSPLADEERNYYEQKYHLSKYSTELPMCIVVPSFNNIAQDRHLKNMRSIIMQEYSNYHIVFIDDASTDGTGDQIEALLAKQKIVPKSRYVIIKNKQQHRAMPNLRMAASKYCKPEDIFIIIDGDDQVLGRQVFRLYNAVFQEKKVLFMYSNYIQGQKWSPVGVSRPFPEEIIRQNKYREYKYSTSHLRAFYTQLFLNIKEEDLKDSEGNYLKAANDVAICLPILEQAHQRIIYIPELTYSYNRDTGSNNHVLRLKEQGQNQKMIRKRKPYKRIGNMLSTIA